MESDINVKKSKLRLYQRRVLYGLVSGIVTIQSARQGVESLLPAASEDKKFDGGKFDQIEIGKLLAWGTLNRLSINLNESVYDFFI